MPPSASTFPSSTWESTNYLVDVMFAPATTTIKSGVPGESERFLSGDGNRSEPSCGMPASYGTPTGLPPTNEYIE